MGIIYLILFIGLGLSLISWQLFATRKTNLKYGMITWLFIIGYFVFMTLSDLSISGKAFFIIKDLLAICFFSFIARMVSRISVLKIPIWIIGLVGLFMFSRFTTPNLNRLVQNHVDTENELLVKLKSDNTSTFLSYLKSIDLKGELAFSMKSKEDTELDNYISIDLKGNEFEQRRYVNKIKNHRDVDYVEYNDMLSIPTLMDATASKASPHISLNDPLLENQWGILKTINNQFVKNLGKIEPKKRPLLAILDTGVDADHEDLKEHFVSIDKKSNIDKNGHGTHCAGIAGAVTNNQKGIGSLNINHIFDITSVQVLAGSGMGTQQKIINGILKAVDKGADVISMSLGGISNDARQKSYNEAIAYANKKGAIVVVAAGNSNRPAKNYSPANSKNVICVHAVDENMKKAAFSNKVEDIEFPIGAPGVNILSTIPNNTYKSFSGTSMATPYVAGMITIMKAIDPTITTERVYELLYRNSVMNESQFIINPGATLEEMIKGE